MEYQPLLASLMARVAEFTPDQLESLSALMEHSQHNVDNNYVVDMPDGRRATSYTIGVGTKDGEMLVPSAWDGEILDSQSALLRALAERDDWPVFQDVGRASRGANLASNLMGYQK